MVGGLGVEFVLGLRDVVMCEKVRGLAVGG